MNHAGPESKGHVGGCIDCWLNLRWRERVIALMRHKAARYSTLTALGAHTASRVLPRTSWDWP
jgi:hypothetical protein